jgi:hypothetical protein
MPTPTSPWVERHRIAALTIAGLLVFVGVWLTLPAGTFPTHALGHGFWSHKVAKASLQVGPPRPLLRVDGDRQETPEERREYRRSVPNLIKNGMVLEHVLARPQVAKSQTVQELLKAGKDPMEWLAENLNVSFLEDSDVLEISLGGDHPKDLAMIVNKVVDSYMQLIVDEEKRQRVYRLQKLQELRDRYQQELKAKRKGLKALADTLGDSGHQEHRRDYVEALGRDLDQLRVARLRADAELAVRKARKGGGENEGKVVAALEESLAVMARQIDSLQAELRREAGFSRGGVDLTSEQEGLRIAEEWARVIGSEVERVQIELDAPDRVRRLSSATPPRD